MDTAARHLAFHGAVVLLIGLLCGAPYARAINRQAPSAQVHGWRVAHLSLPIGAILMLAVAALLPQLTVSPGLKWLLAAPLIVSSYAFCVSLPLGAVIGQRGLASGGPWPAQIVYAGNLIGAWASVLAALALLYATF